MSVHISLTLELLKQARCSYPSIMIFSLERAVVDWAILESSSVFDPSLEMTWSSPLTLASDLLSWSLFRSHLGCLSSLSSCLAQSPFCTLWWLHQDGLPGHQLLLLLHLWLTLICKAEDGNKSSSDGPMLTLPSWLSNASHMILSRKMLNRVGENCSSEPFSCAAIEQDCTLSLIIQIFNDVWCWHWCCFSS